jgi:hypothetical protein
MRYLALVAVLSCVYSAASVFAQPLASYQQLKPGDQVQVPLEHLHPTQAVVGYDQIFYKLRRFQAEPHKLFDEYCETSGQGEAARVPTGARINDPASFHCQQPVGTYPGEMKTVVVGPGGQLYLTDGHHTFTLLWEQPGAGPTQPMWVRVTDNFSDSADLATFWQRMQAERKVWLQDGRGRPLAVETLPDRLGLDVLRDDPYRALVYFAREVAYDKPRSGSVAPEFLEFYWGQWLRGQLNLDRYDLTDKSDYHAALLAVSRLMVAQQPDRPLGDSGYTAAQLGGYPVIDRKELSKTMQRKLSHVIRYKQQLRKSMTAAI